MVLRIHRLKNRVQHYAWGSHTAIPELLGAASPAAEPWAELWLGAHARAPSLVVTEAGEVPLDAFIARDPAAVLGPEVARRFAGELPFLFKVLAAERPLSLQAHPDAAQARAGFARENAAGIPLDADRRCYRDPHPKPELICALTPFAALCGFRPLDELCAHLEALAAPELAGGLASLRAQGAAGLEECFRALWSLSGPAAERLVAHARERAGRLSGPAWRCLDRLAAAFPADPAALAPLLLNRIELAPGEALLLGAGCLHSYLEGVGVELMANSDNVLRGGLTPKHVDVEALRATLVFECGVPRTLRPEPAGEGVWRYAAPVEEFSLARLQLAAGHRLHVPPRRAVEILLCTEGAAACVDAQGERLALDRGASLLVPAAAGPYRLEGEATLYRAGVGSAE